MTGGAIGAQTALTLDGCVARIDAIAEAALAVRAAIIQEFRNLEPTEES